MIALFTFTILQSRVAYSARLEICFNPGERRHEDHSYADRTRHCRSVRRIMWRLVRLGGFRIGSRRLERQTRPPMERTRPSTTDAASANFVYAAPFAIADLDPSSAFSSENILLQNVYETLTRFNPPGSDDLVSPLLAESWESNDDATEWTFTLRSDVTFHDGTPLTADAVVASLQRTIDLDLGAAFILLPIDIDEGDRRTDGHVHARLPGSARHRDVVELRRLHHEPRRGHSGRPIGSTKATRAEPARTRSARTKRT